MGVIVSTMELASGTSPALPGAALESVAVIAARDVVRCQACTLVQFRTQSDLCRRCLKPLPMLLQPEPEEPAGLAQDELAVQADGLWLDEQEPLARAERNRRVGVGSRLRAVRVRLGLTQVEMSERLQIPRTYLSRIENDRLLPGPKMLAKFAGDLGLDVSDVLPSFATQLDDDRRWDGISRRIINVFEQMDAPQMERVLEMARCLAAGMSETACPQPRSAAEIAAFIHP